MSGGSMNYLYSKLEYDATFSTDTPERLAFKRHLVKVAKALYDIEWVDSGDKGPGDENAAIRACLQPDAVLFTLVEQAKDVLGALRVEIDKVEGEFTEPGEWRDVPTEVAQQAEPVREMPSNTRYTVAVEGQALTYWDNIHVAVTNAQRAVYAGVDATTRAIDDLRAGRLAEWSYGFSSVRIYPPQQAEPPTNQCGETCERAKLCAACARALEEPTGKQSLQVEPMQEPVAWMVYTEGGTSAYVTDNPNDLVGAYRALALYTAPPHCPNCASLEAQNNELDRKLAEVERAHGIKE